MIVASLAAGLQLGLVFLGLVLIVLSLVGTYKTRNESRESQADVRTDAAQNIGLGGLLIAVGVVWAAVAADLPTASKWLLTAAVFVICGGVLAARGADAGTKRVVVAATAALALGLTLAGFLVGYYQEFVR